MKLGASIVTSAAGRRRRMSASASAIRPASRRSWASPAGEVPRVRVTEIAPIMLLLALCLAMTVQAGPALRYMEATAQSLHVPRDYVRNVLPTPRATEQVERGGP